MADGVVWMVRFSNGRFVVSDDLDDDDKDYKMKSNGQIMQTGSALCQWMGQDDAMRTARDLIQRNKAIGVKLDYLEVVAVAYGSVPFSGYQHDIQVVRVESEPIVE